jgi:hypothetical protein
LLAEEPPTLLDFKIKSTVVRELEVVEAPPMTGLPPVEGTITATVHLVEDPKLPDPSPPASAPTTPRIQPNPLRNGSSTSRFVFISGTVYDQSRTRLQCHPSGRPGEKITVWSNIDFNHFCGLARFELKGIDGSSRRYDLMMGIINEDPQKLAAIAEREGAKYAPPVIPLLPDGHPAYVIEEANPDANAVQFIEDLHQFYRNEGPRLEAAYHARLQAQADRKAYLLAHPPKPENVTVHFWEREHPVGMSAETNQNAGGK